MEIHPRGQTINYVFEQEQYHLSDARVKAMQDIRMHYITDVFLWAISLCLYLLMSRMQTAHPLLLLLKGMSIKLVFLEKLVKYTHK